MSKKGDRQHLQLMAEHHGQQAQVILEKALNQAKQDSKIAAQNSEIETAKRNSQQALKLKMELAEQEEKGVELAKKLEELTVKAKEATLRQMIGQTMANIAREEASYKEEKASNSKKPELPSPEVVDESLLHPEAPLLANSDDVSKADAGSGLQ